MLFHYYIAIHFRVFHCWVDPQITEVIFSQLNFLPGEPTKKISNNITETMKY